MLKKIKNFCLQNVTKNFIKFLLTFEYSVKKNDLIIAAHLLLY